MARTAMQFQSEDVAQRLVAGLPLAVRAVIALAERDEFYQDTAIQLVVPGGWKNSDILAGEFARTTPSFAIEFTSNASIDAMERVDGFALAIAAELDTLRGPEPTFRGPLEITSAVKTASRRIIRSTGKPSDGLVSQYLNRPISQFISAQLLKLSWIRPIHGTIAAWLLGFIMALCLFLGGEVGLYAGAILFQAASIVDGVDGEIARATMRSSKLGATLDTAGDAATNFAFIAGVSFNLWQSGDALAGQLGLAGLGLLVIGLSVIGWLSVRGGGPLSFDTVKNQAKATSSPMMGLLAKLTSRDVYALVLAIMILIGLAGPAMTLFAVAIATWFVVAMAMLIRG